jgi:hypothetical protein
MNKIRNIRAIRGKKTPIVLLTKEATHSVSLLTKKIATDYTDYTDYHE